MRRRGILALLGGAVALGPFWARAQQSMLEIGFLHQGLPEPIPLMAAFSKGLDAAGIGVERDVRTSTVGPKVNTTGFPPWPRSSSAGR